MGPQGLCTPPKERWGPTLLPRNPGSLQVLLGSQMQQHGVLGLSSLVISSLARDTHSGGTQPRERSPPTP